MSGRKETGVWYVAIVPVSIGTIALLLISETNEEERRSQQL